MTPHRPSSAAFGWPECSIGASLIESMCIKFDNSEDVEERTRFDIRALAQCFTA